MVQSCVYAGGKVIFIWGTLQWSCVFPYGGPDDAPFIKLNHFSKDGTTLGDGGGICKGNFLCGLNSIPAVRALIQIPLFNIVRKERTVFLCIRVHSSLWGWGRSFQCTVTLL
ncbi:hypothetical protein GDO86_019479 [Hymenochirus boettgeri]|uniref:Uncharacterized protein n=1 Tax=Hymenochirus boettgeri TaxID=247094 RepID=A0A8T2IIT2_9PIPI|nr:hypothetical protein GDO86_019479 [Hymenochirus boettgeri]